LAVNNFRKEGERLAGSVNRQSGGSGWPRKRRENSSDDQRYQVLFDQASDAIFIHAIGGQFLEVNETACELLGYSREQLLKMRLRDIALPEHEERIVRWVEQLERQGLRTVETACRTSAGNFVPVEISARIIQFEGARAVLSTARDITGRYRVEPRLRERTHSLEMANAKLQEEVERRKLSEQAVSKERDRAQYYLDLAGVMFLTLDLQGTVTMINRMGSEILGRPESGIVGSNWFDDFLPKDKKQRARTLYGEFVSGQRPEPSFGESDVISADGSRKKIAWHNTVLRDGQGAAVGTLSSGVDITERKRMERTLKREQRKLREMLSHESLISTVAARFNSALPFEKNLDELLPLFGQTAALDSVVLWQLDQQVGSAGIFSRWESARGVRCALAREFCRDDLPDFFDGLVKGHSLAAGPGRIGSELLSYFKFSADCALLIFPLSFGGKVKGAIRYSRANGMDWSDEEVSMFGAVSEIVTNAWERDSEFQARLAAERSNTDSVKMVERATRLASIGVIAAGITHEINQPLNAIRLTSDGTMMWIERNGIDLPVKIIDRLSKISSHVERITRIIKHMREFWASTDKQGSDVFDLSAAVEDALGLVEQQLKSHGIELRRNYCSGIATVAGDRLHIEQIAINLIVNSMQALDCVRDGEKWLEVSTRVEEGFCILEIVDSGPGFPSQDRERMFDMFYSTKKPGEGTGLGLAIVKRYAEELGGTVEAENGAEGAGALFRINIPLIEHQELT
jgi:PAS domain S-box-containing protein